MKVGGVVEVDAATKRMIVRSIITSEPTPVPLSSDAEGWALDFRVALEAGQPAAEEMRALCIDVLYELFDPTRKKSLAELHVLLKQRASRHAVSKATFGVAARVPSALPANPSLMRSCVEIGSNSVHWFGDCAAVNMWLSGK